MSKLALATGCLLLRGGCAGQVTDFAREPHLTPVGAGLRPDRVAMLSDPPPVRSYQRGNSVWQDPSADLFRDPRAMRVGDVVTVKISIKDKASFDNTSERSRDSKRNLNFDTNYDLKFPFLTGKGEGKLDSTINSGTSTNGQ